MEAVFGDTFIGGFLFGAEKEKDQDSPRGGGGFWSLRDGFWRPFGECWWLLTKVFGYLETISKSPFKE